MEEKDGFPADRFLRRSLTYDTRFLGEQLGDRLRLFVVDLAAVAGALLTRNLLCKLR